MGNYKAYSGVELGDKTLSKRVETTLEQLSSDPMASISGACKDPHQAKAVYRLLSNEKFTADAVLRVSKTETITRIAESGVRVVLLPQDTMMVNYSNLKATEGLGDISDNQNSSGIISHSCIAVSEEGQVFGMLSEKAWVRPKDEYGKKGERKQVPIEEKESYKWLETLDNSRISEELDNVQCIYLCDREGDIYELFAKAALERMTYICRRVQNRILTGESEDGLAITTYLEKLPIAGEIVVKVPRDSHTQHKTREAKLEVKFGTTAIKKPKILNKYKEIPTTVGVSLVSAQEIEAPDGVEAISWQLVTNDSVETFEDAVRCVKRYTQRWKIEIFHRVLKSGCAIEKLQESTADKLIKLIALYSIIALQIMDFTYLSRTNPDASCETMFCADEWVILYKVVHKTKSFPEKPPTVLEATIMIAKLGGFLARKSDGFPGVTVLWRGLTSFFSILEASKFLT